MAYLELSRGCPMHCTYCRYPQLRHAMSFLTLDDVLQRVSALRKMGAREIRFVDPTFNAHPRFREIIRHLAKLNRNGRLKFFAELDAGRLSSEDAEYLSAAGFEEIEVGVQSRDPAVLKVIRRPTSLTRLDAGIRHLTRQRIKVTVDIMYGLPLQTVADTRRSVKRALRLPGVNVQCLQTLLLPGTELRDRNRQWDIQALSRPPYAVTRTSTMNEADYRTVEAMIARQPRLRSDVPTTRFVGKKLDLFKQRIRVYVAPGGLTVKGATDSAGVHQNRRAYFFKGKDLFGQAAELGLFIRELIRRDPDSLFQFVLCPQQEEPLDLLDSLIAIIRSEPGQLLDRYASVALDQKIASRRLMIKLSATGRISRQWNNAAETILSRVFF